MRTKIFPALGSIAILPFLILAVACATPPQAAAESGPGTRGAQVAEEAAPGGNEAKPARPAARNEFTVVMTDRDLELNPLKSFKADEAQVFTALYEGLFTYHPFTLDPVPALASSWKLSEDKRTWTFTLREGARYWNGDEVLASHLRDSWLAMIDPRADAAYSSLFDFIEGAKDYRLGKLRDADKVGISVEGPGTLVVRLASPAAYFPRVLCHHSFAPVHPDMLKQADWASRPVLSNGPYYIYERKDDRLVLVKNELYWDAKNVSIPRIVIRFAKDGAEAASLYDSAEAQWVAGDVDLDALKDRRGISLNAMFATHYYYVRSAAAPWNDKRVRRALSLALPWEEIRKEHLLPAATLIYPIPDYPKLDGVKETKADEAKKLLADAGYAAGVGVPELVLRITPGTDAARIAALMAGAWKETLGIRTRVDVVPFDRYYDALKKDDYVVGSSTWIGDFADPYTFLQMWRADSNLNDAKYRDEDYEKLVDRSLTEEGEERYKTMSEAERLLLEDGVVLPISYTPAINIVDTDEIDGWFQNPLDIHPFKYFSYAAYRPLPGVAMLRMKE